MGIRMGIDLGGTKTEVIALDESGSQLFRTRVATPREDYDGTLATIVKLVRDAEASVGAQGTVGVAMPGAISPATGMVKNANSTWLIGRPFAQDLERALGREVRVANDADCFALSEATDGAGQGEAVVFGVILGTGVGGGIVVHGRLLNGPNAIAGEWGHNPLPLPRDADLPLPACYCGRNGCIETYLSGPALTNDHLRATGEMLDARAIVERGDASCDATLSRYEERLARALAGVINVLDPGVIVLGGGMSNIGRLYERVPESWRAHVFSDHVATRLVRHEHGDSSGVRGAAWL